ncbi:hypothetical protein [Ligilactobacillus agilis]|uniref:hypothetical protein n=1 Tax=Ligilactobacillus agilis TaxID=1601 RepID=UPI0015C5A7A5|nr:hypothetical protein [Ligilactobacillus agilis]
MEKKEIVELSSFKNRKATNGMSKSITEIKFNKVKIVFYKGVDFEIMNDVWELVKKYVD